MSKKSKVKRPPMKPEVERLDHMIGQSLVRKKNFKSIQSITNEKALFEMIDARIGNMLAKSCEIESKIEAIEKQRPKRKLNNFDSRPNNNNFSQSTITASSSAKKKGIHSSISLNSQYSEETEESIPHLQSASKFLMEEGEIQPNNQHQIITKKSQKLQQKQEIFKQKQKQEKTENLQQQEFNFYQFDQNVPKQSQPSKDVSIEALFSLIQTLASDIHELRDEQQVLKGQIEKMQESMFSNE